MSYNSARIESTEVIKGFRAQIVEFNETCRQAVTGIGSDSQRTRQWLQHDQHRHWTMELKKADELVRQARSAYILARFGADHLRKPSYIEEQKILRKAERRKEEAENKIRVIKKWESSLEQQTQKMMGPITQFSFTLELEVPRALAKLDLMVEKLEEYLR